MRIEAYYDILCPFSFLAKRYVERCMAEFPQVEVAIELKPFMLQPGLPLEPHDFRAVFVGKYGEGARVPMWDRVAALGREIGIAFAFERITFAPHSIHGHRAVGFAEQYGRGRDMLERIYRAFYEEASCPWRPAELAELAQGLDIPQDEMRAYLESGDDEAEIFALTERYRVDPGVTGMPFHVIDGRPFKPESSLAPWRQRFAEEAARGRAQSA